MVDGKKSTTERTDVAKVVFQHVVGAAWDSSSSEHVEPIWNTGFLKCFFRDDSLGHAVAPQFKRPMPTSDFSGGEPGDTDERQKIDVPQVLSGPYFQTRVKGTENCFLAGEMYGSSSEVTETLVSFNHDLEM